MKAVGTSIKAPERVLNSFDDATGCEQNVPLYPALQTHEFKIHFPFIQSLEQLLESQLDNVAMIWDRAVFRSWLSFVE